MKYLKLLFHRVFLFLYEITAKKNANFDLENVNREIVILFCLPVVNNHRQSQFLGFFQ